MVQLICLTMRIGQNRCSAAKNDLLMRISFAFVNMSPQHAYFSELLQIL
jgi:hypothetical protein